jgi:2',3'-cyclic-nucleotide 2'-phosphodiesterase (5'-nucleotidase family)
MSGLTILHTNDLHGKLTEEAAEILARERSSYPNCLLLDAGDAVPSGNIYWRPGGEPILSLMSDIGYDAMAMGNREFHFLATGLKSKVKLARFPVLSANIRSNSTSIDSFVIPSITLKVGELTVAIFGLTVPMITKQMFARKLSPFWFEEPLSAAKEIVPLLRRSADVVIALTHIGVQSDVELAKSIDGIDIVVGGHTHTLLSEPILVGNTAIVQAGHWGQYLGKTELTISLDSGPKVRTTLIDLRT